MVPATDVPASGFFTFLLSAFRSYSADEDYPRGGGMLAGTCVRPVFSRLVLVP